MSNKDFVTLVVDDEREHADGIAEALEKCCSQTIAVYCAKDAIQIIRSKRVDVVVCDLRLEEDTDGLEVLEEAKKNGERSQVIVITAYGSIDTCKEAMRRGAFDYIVKPIDIDQLRTLVEQAGQKALTSAQRLEQVPRAGGDEFVFEGVRGLNPAVARIFEVLKRVSPTNISVLIEGPSGSGKELLARAIHNNSPRRYKAFKPINCAGLSETLLESELFGHIKGAFTGAATDRKGLFEAADKGTLFLDEIGDMPLTMQAKLLRVLEDGVIVPVGSNKPIVVDVRIISATNHDLTRLIEEKKFRQDLYFRIKGVSLTVPGLKERAEDIPAFIDYFLKEAAEEIGSPVTGITDAARNILVNYNWPGNIRQLRNCIRTMVVMCDRKQLDAQDIPPEIHHIRQLGSGTSHGNAFTGVSLEELEKQAITNTLAQTGNNRELAAKILGIGERTLYRKIKEYNL